MHEDSVSNSASIVPTPQKLTLGDRIRSIASQLRQEDDVQIKATSRILGAAAQLAENHDRLIDEVVEMVEDDLDQVASPPQPEPYTVEKLQQQFENFNEAKAHFNLKARGWDALVEKLNEQFSSPSAEPQSAATTRSSRSRSNAKKAPQDGVSQHLEGIEQELQGMRRDMSQMIQLLGLMVEKLP